MDRFESLRNFVSVVETGSISAAAERQRLAKSGVSRRLAELEQHLGVQLFRRTTRRMNLTDTGRSFYERARRLLDDLEEAELAVSSEHGALQGHIKLALPLSFGLGHLPPAIAEFMSRHPDLEIELDMNDRQVDLLQEGVDVAVRIAELDDSSLIARRLAPIRHVVCASPAYLARHGTPRSLEELRGHRCLVYSNLPEPEVWRCRLPNGEPGEVRLRPHMRANNGEMLALAAEAGQGLVLEPTFILYRSIRAGRLQPVLTDHAWREVQAYAVYPRTRHLSRRVRALVDFLAERFAGEPYWDDFSPRAGSEGAVTA
jgi:DNA-binding transcriptional LysR family regulator